MENSLDRIVPWQSITGNLDRGSWARSPTNPNLSLDPLAFQNALAQNRMSLSPTNPSLTVPNLNPGGQNFSTLGSLFTSPGKSGISSLQSSMGLNTRLADMERATKAAIQAQLAAAAADQAGDAGDMASDGLGRASAMLDRWDNGILKASAATGVPANVIKAIMSIESGGEPNARSPSGYLGLMQIGPDSANARSIDWSRAYDPDYNILKGAEELALKRNAARSYFGREPTWAETAGFYFGWGGSDSLGTSTGQYMARFTSAYNQLQSTTTSGGALAGGGGYSGGTGLGRAFPAAGNISPNFGVTSGNGLYGYGTSYGLNGSQHTGLDIMQPLKSPIYAPAGGQVICVGCWRNDHLTGGIGRIEVLMPDGAHVLFDHTFSSVVKVGDRIQAGQLLGYSGGMYSPHTHLEVRYPDRNTSSGYRLIDPLQYFGGAGSSTGINSLGAQQAQQRINQPGFGAKPLNLTYNVRW
jgi:murein DD-endopeptidase MepM/ murein hydrolase activator NlpD